jgi:glutamyl-tRNA synthetase
VVVDDAAQGVGKVVRGADLMDTTPRQLLLARHLGLAPPRYAHVPLVLGADGARLAKRHGGVTLGEISPEAALEWIAGSLGLPARRTPRALLDGFDPRSLGREPVTFDATTLKPR